MDKLIVICDALHVDPFYLIKGTEYDNSKTLDYIHVYKNDPEYELILEYCKLDYGKKKVKEQNGKNGNL